jgi:hypothetical protein
MVLTDYPGYERGLARMRRVEDVLRTFALTRLPEKINGIEVRQLTPRMLDLLVLTNSIFLVPRETRHAVGVAALPEEVAQFLWIVSLQNPLNGRNPPKGFFASLRPDEHDYFQRFYRTIDRYMDRALLDRPAAAVGGRIVSTAFSVAIVHRIAAGYGWPAEVADAKGRPVQFAGILDMPIARLYQYTRWLHVDADPSAPIFSRFQDAFRKRKIIKWRARAVADGRFGSDIATVDVRSYLIATGKLRSSQPASAEATARQAPQLRQSGSDLTTASPARTSTPQPS